MMMRNTRARLAALAPALAPALALALGLAACASPDPSYFTLQPVPGTPLAIAPKVIEIRKPGLAGYLDRSDLVLRDSAYHLALAKNTRWAEPLGDMIGRVLAQDVQLRLPAASVHGEEGAISADPDLRVEVDVNRFDAGNDGSVTLEAGLAVEAGITHHAVAARTVTLSAPAGQGASGLAAAMSTLLGELADRVAQDVARGAGA